MLFFSQKNRTFAANILLSMPRYTVTLLAIALFSAVSCQNTPSAPGSAPLVDAQGRPLFFASFGTPVLDGSAADDIWDACDWYPIHQVWAGTAPGPTDFSGRYKLAWDENNLYVLAEITDDSLFDIHPEGLERYWDDDGLEIHLDEDASGGDHSYNHNAFTYHIALDGRVTDVAPDSVYRFYDDHCFTRRITRQGVSTWEMAVRIFDGAKFKDDAENIPKLLKAGKKMGFALAYGDNDHSAARESLIGNVPNHHSGPDSAFWNNAGSLGILELK